VIPSLGEDGFLPRGRYHATIPEVEGTFVTNSVRSSIWEDWKRLCKLVGAVAGTDFSVWLGGSFISSKVQPGDIDSVFLIRREVLIDMTQEQHDLLSIVGSARTKDVLGLNVDSYTITIDYPTDASFPQEGTNAFKFISYRGYWDNLWASCRGDHGMIGDSRGYLEVIVDDSI